MNDQYRILAQDNINVKKLEVTCIIPHQNIEIIQITKYLKEQDYHKLEKDQHYRLVLDHIQLQKVLMEKEDTIYQIMRTAKQEFLINLLDNNW